MPQRPKPGTIFLFDRTKFYSARLYKGTNMTEHTNYVKTCKWERFDYFDQQSA